VWIPGNISIHDDEIATNYSLAKGVRIYGAKHPTTNRRR